MHVIYNISMTMKNTLLSLFAFISIAATISAQESPLWLRRNAISPDGTQIAFTYKGDIYTVATEGGQARQITTNPAYDSDPMWTDDSKTIVFSSYREGSKDIYKVSAKGGEPTRLTTHPGNETPMVVLENNNGILFKAAIQQDAQYGDFPGEAQVYQIGMDGGRPRQVTSLPISNISVRMDGTLLYEDYKGYEDPWRKHHTSSVTHDIWIYVPSEDHEKVEISINGNGDFTKLTTFSGEDRNPVFAPTGGMGGDSFYYLSEQDGTYNIYYSGSLQDEIFASGEPKMQPKQITFYKGNPVRHLSISNNEILCYSYDGELYTIDTQKGDGPQKVQIEIVTDRIEKAAHNDFRSQQRGGLTG